MSESGGAVHFILYLFMDAFSSSVVEVVNAYKTLVRKPKGRHKSEDPGVKGRAILKSILRKLVRGCGLDISE
jgi:hypothetical protein